MLQQRKLVLVQKQLAEAQKELAEFRQGLAELQQRFAELTQGSTKEQLLRKEEQLVLVRRIKVILLRREKWLQSQAQGDEYSYSNLEVLGGLTLIPR